MHKAAKTDVGGNQERQGVNNDVLAGLGAADSQHNEFIGVVNGEEGTYVANGSAVRAPVSYDRSDWFDKKGTKSYRPLRIMVAPALSTRGQLELQSTLTFSLAVSLVLLGQ